MSQAVKHLGAEHLLMAAKHLETAALQHREAAKSYNSGNDDKAGHFALVARGELVLAQDHEQEASKFYAAEYAK